MEGIVLEAVRALESLDKQLRAWELERLLGGPYDQGGAVLTIQVRRRTEHMNGSVQCDC